MITRLQPGPLREWGLGLVAGVLSGATFSAVLVAVVITTVAAPYMLAFAVPRATEEASVAATGTPSAAGP
mgnify:CR=1 FL=1